jgi:hypothetical protein
MLPPIHRLLDGNFQRPELYRYVGLLSLTFWGLILIAWLCYPAENHYSIMTHTFSFLGSFEEKHSPDYWFFFTIAMAFWGTAMFPVVQYIHRRFLLISVWGAHIGRFFYLTGCIGIVLVACFPDARGEVIGDWEWTDIHEKAAIIAFANFFLAVLWHGALLVKDRLAVLFAGHESGFPHGLLAIPHLVWAAITGLGVYHLIAWETIYAERKLAAQATGQPIGSSWTEALNTRYSFPLWENILIYTLFAFILWFTLAIPREASTHKTQP